MGDISGDAAHSEEASEIALQHTILRPLADELMAIASRLREAAIASPEDVTDRPRARATRNHLTLARKTYTLRRKRAAIFGNPDLFGEPAWDILLDLFIAHGEGKPVSVSSACIGSASPATTGLRWLGVLADEGLIIRENDADDHRRVLVRLSIAGVTAMERFLDALQDAGI